jgi:hypothetical protein
LVRQQKRPSSAVTAHPQLFSQWFDGSHNFFRRRTDVLRGPFMFGDLRATFINSRVLARPRGIKP